MLLAWCSLLPIFIMVGFVTLILFRRDLHTVSSSATYTKFFKHSKLCNCKHWVCLCNKTVDLNQTTKLSGYIASSLKFVVSNVQHLSYVYVPSEFQFCFTRKSHFSIFPYSVCVQYNTRWVKKPPKNGRPGSEATVYTHSLNEVRHLKWRNMTFILTLLTFFWGPSEKSEFRLLRCMFNSCQLGGASQAWR